jgi:ABC-type Zn uptake system ZnuABC Zn-binding protein ZnuA
LYKRLYGDELVSIVGGTALADLSRAGNLLTFLRDNAYEGRPLLDRLGGWLKAAEPFRGRDVICYHKNWAYFEQRFQVRCVDFVEAKPGIPPTPGHVAQLIRRMQGEGIDIVLATTYQDRNKVASVAERGGAKVVQVPLEPGVRPGVDDYFALVDAWVTELAAAFAAR